MTINTIDAIAEESGEHSGSKNRLNEVKRDGEASSSEEFSKVTDAMMHHNSMLEVSGGVKLHTNKVTTKKDGVDESTNSM